LAAMLAAGPLHHLGALSDQAGPGDVTGPGASGRLVFGQDGFGCESFGDDLIGCLAFQHTLTTGIVGGVEATQELFELAVGIDRDGEHLTADVAVEALDQAIGLRRTRTGVAVFRAQCGTGLGGGSRPRSAHACSPRRSGRWRATCRAGRHSVDGAASPVPAAPRPHHPAPATSPASGHPR
jgi:hypothetical protein